MAKVSGTSVQPGQATELEQQTIALPAQRIQEEVPQASPAGGSIIGRVATNLSSPEVQAAVQEGTEAALTEQQQIESERIPSLAERGQDTQTVHKWEPRGQIANPATPHTDGGLRDRARKMARDFGTTAGIASLNVTPTTAARPAALEGDTAEVARIEGEALEGSLTAALNRSGAVTTTQDPVSRKFTNAIDPVMLNVGSVVTENMLSDAAFGEADPEVTPIDPDSPAPTVSKAQNNTALGKEIHRQYSRMKNELEGRPTDDYQDLPSKEATTLGDAFKEMWAISNPDLVRKSELDENGQRHFQLTPEGVQAMKNSSRERKRLLPKVNVRPAKAPTQTGQLPGETGRVATKRDTGKVKRPLVGAKVLNEATRNLNTVPNVVDKQRMKILWTTALPVLSGQLGIDHEYAAINNMGDKQYGKFLAAQRKNEIKAQEGIKVDPYDADAEMESLQKDIAQDIRAIAQERNGANFLTYYIQSFNGRIAPQQSAFDPTTSKAVRFVTRNVVPAKASPGSRIARNLEQMYAMMLVKGADSLLPEGRLEAFDKDSSRLEQWGDRLLEVLNDTISDSEAEAIAAAIDQGIALTDPKFPEVRPLGLDPVKDKDLLDAIKDKGEDGPHFIDGLIDAAQYIKAKRDGRPYHSYFNAYVDGKTNGIASNGIQMGSEQIARGTGVIRNQGKTLLDSGDVRDQLQNILLEKMSSDGFTGHLKDEAPQLYDVARTLFSTRQLHKDTTMTFSYGKELASFVEDIKTHLLEQQANLQGNPDSTYSESLDALVNDPNWGLDKLADTLNNFYKSGLAEVLSEEAIQSRALMRSAATLFAVTNQLFTIKSPTGFELAMGGSETLGADQELKTKYRITTPEGVMQPSVYHYGTEATSANIRRDVDAEGRDRSTPGQDAYGGSIPAPVQSIDAATVALAASGKAWDKLKSASNGNPYMHTIYDAFKFDAMGFDVGVEAVNKAWLDSSMDWSYLEETRDSLQQIKDWDKRMNDVPQSTEVDISMAGPYRMVGYLLKPVETDGGKKFPSNLTSKLKKLVGGANEAQQENMAREGTQRIIQSMKDAGFNVYADPKTMTVGQLRTFVRALEKELNLSKRMGAMINATNKNKKRLRKMIDAQKRLHGNDVLQYYAH